MVIAPGQHTREYNPRDGKLSVSSYVLKMILDVAPPRQVNFFAQETYSETIFQGFCA
jgi:hypothetical protein